MSLKKAESRHQITADQGHDHSSMPLRALLIALGITGTVFFAELIGGWLAGSMALMADAMHMLSDAAGLIIGTAVGVRALKKH